MGQMSDAQDGRERIFFVLLHHYFSNMGLKKDFLVEALPIAKKLYAQTL